MPDMPNTLNTCEMDWSMQRHMTQMLDFKLWTSLLSAAKWGGVYFVLLYDVFSIMGYIAVWISPQRTDFAQIYLPQSQTVRTGQLCA